MTVATAGPDRARVRGLTDISPRVVERIAGRVAIELPDVFPPPRTGVARLVGTARALPPVTADLDDDTVALEIDVAMHYPVSLAAAGADLRATVARRVRELTGIRVERLEINIVAFVLRGRPRRRVE
jgi:uncharacterized alkaline shock family protein YloU